MARTAWKVKAKFLGNTPSLGYEPNKVYTLLVNASVVTGYEHCPIVIEREDGGGVCPYLSQESFDANWDCQEWQGLGQPTENKDKPHFAGNLVIGDDDLGWARLFMALNRRRKPSLGDLLDGVNSLDGTSKAIIVARFGLDGLGRRTLKQLSKEYGLAVEWIRRKEYIALRNIREVVLTNDK